MSTDNRHTPSSDPDKHDQDPNENGEVFDETDSSHPHRVRKKIRVRKRIRVRKKPSAKKKIKKIAERAFWFLIIGGFIAALIVMIVELDIRDEKFKKKKQKATPTRSTY
jgi:hypothetical protein